jgi:predicted alpha/beta superfamily hydrolase
VKVEVSISNVGARPAQLERRAPPSEGAIFRRLCIFFALTALSLVASPGEGEISNGLQPAGEIVSAQRFKIHSGILNEDRDLLVYLPESYNDSEYANHRYPVIYLLDGFAYFDATIGIVHHLSARSAAAQRIPESIVIGIRNTNRRRDMTPSRMTTGPYSEGSGGAAFFRAFLEKDLIPQVDAGFRTDGTAILIGHSLAGLFVLDTFVEHPQLFQGYIASDPSLWWDHNLLAQKMAKQKKPSAKSRVKLFIAQANTHPDSADDMKVALAHRAGIAAFRKALGNSHEFALDSYKYFDDESHLSVPLLAIYTGLLLVYSDYKKE